MKVLTTVAEVRAARAQGGDFGGDLGLVPTMGFLHAGHLSLVARARAENPTVAATIFVNPTQFGPNEDLARYPRDMPRDLALLEAAGCDLVFAPEPAEIYPAGFDTVVEVRGVTEGLEGAARPGHFAGVATVVAKLFNIAQPMRAYFGQKDAQQSVVIRKMVRDLNLPVEVVVAPTVRERDGLAMSSRNSYLTSAERAQAPGLYRALCAAKAAFDAGERDAEAETLRELDRVEGPALASLAARLGTTRLIDNLPLS
jgi:pantoate--beta-alanine ligase